MAATTPDPAKPTPEPTLDSLPYWEGLRAHRLVLQRCAACGKVRHYPRPVCDACHSMDAAWTEASGRATVHSWTVCHHAFHPGFKRELPYVLVTVDLDEGVRLVAPAERIAEEALAIGLPVEIGFHDTRTAAGEPLTLPVVRPRASG